MGPVNFLMAHGQQDGAALRKFHRVAQEVDQDLLQAYLVAVQTVRDVPVNLGLEGHRFRLQARVDHGRDVGNQMGDLV